MAASVAVAEDSVEAAQAAAGDLTSQVPKNSFELLTRLKPSGILAINYNYKLPCRRKKLYGDMGGG